VVSQSTISIVPKFTRFASSAPAASATHGPSANNATHLSFNDAEKEDLLADLGEESLLS
jgi:hypothetical protein